MSVPLYASNNFLSTMNPGPIFVVFSFITRRKIGQTAQLRKVGEDNNIICYFSLNWMTSLSIVFKQTKP